MLGLMQDWPLLQHKIIDHAALQYGDQEVVTRSIEGPIHRTNYRDLRARALKENARKLRSMHARGYDTLKSIRTTGFMKSVTSFITLNHFVSLH